VIVARPEGVTEALVTFGAVFAYVKVVVVGTDVIVYEPLNVEFMLITETVIPTTKPCGEEVVSVTTLEVKLRVVIDAVKFGE
jgi:hypothetical protein